MVGTARARLYPPYSSRANTQKALPNRRRVLDAAGVPELVEAARNLELGLAADIAIVNLAVIADMADDAHRPVLGQPEVLAVSAFGADQPHHIRLLRLQGFVDV